MEDQLASVHEHIRGLGLGALAHANWHANYFSHENAYWSELSVLQAAHAAELLIKARIAQEHPLLIFEHLPKAQNDNAQSLSLKSVIERGRTFQFADLPDRLWATTGKRLANLERYRSFGLLRNAIQHFAVPDGINVGDETVGFIYEIIDPFINDCWGLYAVDFNEDYDPHVYLVATLIRRGVRFLVSPEVIERYEYIEFDWPKRNPRYRKEMLARFEAARSR